MNDNSDNKKPLDLSSLDFGPAWAREDSSKKSHKKFSDRGDRGGKGGGRKGGRRPEGGGRQSFDKGGRGRKPQHGQGRRGDRPERKPLTPAPEGVTADIMPLEEGVDNMAKEIAASGRTYSVFDLARVVLKARERYQIVFSQEKDEPIFFQCGRDGSVFLTKDECLAHFATSEWKGELYTSEEVEVEAPTGNYPSVACCGFSGKPLAPPNYHGYQTIVAEVHAAEFSNMSLEKYKSRIQTMKDEEKVAEWMESMKKATHYKPAGDEESVLDSAAAMTQHFEANHFEKEFRATHRANVPSSIPAKQLSPGLLTALKEIISDQTRYPGKLASFLCRQLSGRHLAVFKWQGKLHAGPSRPHAVAQETVMADRPSAMLTWINENIGAGIDELWKAVLPEGADDKVKHEWYHDLHWLLNQGHAVLLEDGHVFPSSESKKKPAAKKAAKKGKGGKPAAKQTKPEVKAEKPAEKAPEAKADEAPAKDEPAETPAKEEAKADEPKADAPVEEKPAEKAEDQSEAKTESEAEGDKPAAE